MVRYDGAIDDTRTNRHAILDVATDRTYLLALVLLGILILILFLYSWWLVDTLRATDDWGSSGSVIDSLMERLGLR